MPNLTGKGLAPLPGESSLSSLWHIAWRNSLGTKELFRLLSSYKSISKYNSFLDPSYWINSSISGTRLGIELPHPGEVYDLGTIMSCPGGWLSTKLRFCPICLEHGYHSYWYQLRDLNYCPIHGCRITSECQSCGNQLPEYRFSKDLFENPYFCPKCHAPLSGATPVLSYIKDFRQHFDQLKTCYEVLENWAHGIKGHKCRAICHTASALDRCHWRKHEEMLWELGRICHPLPEAPLLSSTTGMEVLRWRVQMVVTPWQFRPKRISIRYDRINVLWSALIRRLHYWIYGALPSSRFAEVERRYNEEYHHIQLDQWDDRELAFSIFLDHCEGHLRVGATMSADGPGNLPNIGLSFWEGRISRLGFMYSMLAAFAGLVLTIRSEARISKVLDLFQLRLRQRQWCAVHFQYSRQGLCTGAAVFSKLDGYPVHWSAAIKTAYASKSPELMRPA